jgi:hypothetical protein
MSPDPANVAVRANPQTWNLYTYVNNNPMGFSDPRGTNPLPVDIGDHSENCEKHAGGCTIGTIAGNEARRGDPCHGMGA